MYKFCDTKRGLCKIIGQVEEAKKNKWSQLVGKLRHECVSVWDEKQQPRNRQKPSYNSRLWLKYPQKEFLVDMPRSGGLCRYELMSQIPVFLFKCPIQQRFNCMGSRWPLYNTIEQSETRHSSNDFISGISSSTWTPKDGGVISHKGS